MNRSRFCFLLAGLALFGPVVAEVLPQFPAGSVWRQEITGATTHPNSASMIGTLAAICSGDVTGCGFGLHRMQIDFSIKVLHAPVGAPTAILIQHQGFGDYFLPDCDPLGSTVPVPIGGSIEGSPDYVCDNNNNDCHLLVVQGSNLYELYSANQASAGASMEALCLARWNLAAVYPPEGRGDHCTSADAAGFPMAPLLFNADEVRAAINQPLIADRHLGHAIRFILPNDRMASFPDGPDANSLRDPMYVRPASHAGGPDGPEASVPYGSRLRLRADFPFTNYSPAAQVILRTMQRYGIVLADGGTIALTAEADDYTTAKWLDPDIDLGSRVFDQTAGATLVQVSDFQVLDTGPRILETYDCVRAPEPVPSLFADGFEN